MTPEYVWRPSRPYMLAGDRHDAARAPRRGTQRYQWPREESVAQGAESACGDGSGTITTGHAVRRAQARATDPGASRRSHPRCRHPSTSRSPPRTSLASSAAARPQTTCCPAGTSSGIRPNGLVDGGPDQCMTVCHLVGERIPGRPGGVLVDVGHGHGRWTKDSDQKQPHPAPAGLPDRPRQRPPARSGAADAHDQARDPAGSVIHGASPSAGAKSRTSRSRCP